MEPEEPHTFHFEHEGETATYEVEGVGADYKNQSQHPIGLIADYKDELLKTDLANRAEVLAEDYSDLFELGLVPDVYKEKFRPLADLIQATSSVETLEQIEQENDLDRYALRFYANLASVPDETVQYIDQSDFFISVNPVNAKRVLSDKFLQQEFLDEHNVPIIPGINAAWAVIRGEEYTRSEVGDTGEGWIIKHANGYGGYHVHHAPEFDQIEEILQEQDADLEGRTNYLLQPFIDHDFDYRFKLVGETGRAAEKRVGVEGNFRTNLSQMEGTKGERVLKGLREGTIQMMGVDDERTMTDFETRDVDSMIPREIQELGDDIIDAFTEFTAADSPVPNLFIGSDIMMTDRSSLEGLPSEYVDRMEEYEVDGAIPAVVEVNDGGGDIIDTVHYFRDSPDMPLLHKVKLLKDIAGVESLKPRKIHDNYNIPAWRRVEVSYGGNWPLEVVAMENIQTNTIDTMMDAFMDDLGPEEGIPMDEGGKITPEEYEKGLRALWKAVPEPEMDEEDSF